MDEQMKNILDRMGAREIGLDEEFKFHCSMCGKCCIHREDILLNPKDVYSMSKELKITPEKLIDQYCEMYIGSDSRVPIVRLAPRGQMRRCPLFKNRKCIVHSAKPAVCAMYPLGRCMAVENVPGADAREGKTLYILNHTECGDASGTYTVREWLGMFGIPAEDEFFKKWQKTAVYLAQKFNEMEKHAGGDEMMASGNIFQGKL